MRKRRYLGYGLQKGEAEAADDYLNGRSRLLGPRSESKMTEGESVRTYCIAYASSGKYPRLDVYGKVYPSTCFCADEWAVGSPGRTHLLPSYHGDAIDHRHVL